MPYVFIPVAVNALDRSRELNRVISLPQIIRRAEQCMTRDLVADTLTSFLLTTKGVKCTVDHWERPGRQKLGSEIRIDIMTRL